MDGIEIRQRIDENNLKIQQAIKKFVLTDEIKNLMEDNDNLRKHCKHNFIDGVCEYCDAFEGATYED